MTHRLCESTMGLGKGGEEGVGEGGPWVHLLCLVCIIDLII